MAKDKNVYVGKTVLEPIDTNKLQLVYEDEIIAMYIELSSQDHIKIPYVRCSGQFETYLHNIDALNKRGAYGHSYSRIDKSIFTPLIIVPKYNSIGVSKSYANRLTMDEFSKSTYEAINELNIDNYVMSGHSFGGTLTVKMSLDKRFMKGVAIHPAIMGSVLANIPKLKELSKKGELKGYEKPLAYLISKIVDYRFGFIKEFAKVNTLEELKVLGDWSKITILGGYMNPDETKGILKYTSKMMSRIAEMENVGGLKNDGFINWDEKIIKELEGVYVPLKNVTHFDVANLDYQIYTSNILTEGKLRR